MVTFICPNCGQERTGVRARCYPCTGPDMSRPEVRDKIRATLTGVKHSEERRERASQVRKRLYAEGISKPFDLAAFMHGKPWPKSKPVGYTRVSNGHIQIKCADGKFRYRARAMWEEAYGPIPRGYLIHHKNEDPFDDRLDNFQMVTRAEHALLHADSDTMRERGAKGGKPRLVKD